MSFIIGAALLVCSIIIGGGGHGSLLPFQIIFPLPSLIGYFFKIELTAFILCLAQFPVYTYVIQIAPKKRNWFLLSLIHFGFFALVLFLEY